MAPAEARWTVVSQDLNQKCSQPARSEQAYHSWLRETLVDCGEIISRFEQTHHAVNFFCPNSNSANSRGKPETSEQCCRKKLKIARKRQKELEKSETGGYSSSAILAPGGAFLERGASWKSQKNAKNFAARSWATCTPCELENLWASRIKNSQPIKKNRASPAPPVLAQFQFENREKLPLFEMKNCLFFL